MGVKGGREKGVPLSLSSRSVCKRALSCPFSLPPFRGQKSEQAPQADRSILTEREGFAAPGIIPLWKT